MSQRTQESAEPPSSSIAGGTGSARKVPPRLFVDWIGREQVRLWSHFLTSYLSKRPISHANRANDSECESNGDIEICTRCNRRVVDDRILGVRYPDRRAGWRGASPEGIVQSVLDYFVDGVEHVIGALLALPDLCLSLLGVNLGRAISRSCG